MTRKWGRSRRPPHNLKTKDHIRPRSRGGWLVVACCIHCNARKRDQTLYEWLKDPLYRVRKADVSTLKDTVRPMHAGRLIALYKEARPSRFKYRKSPR